MKLPNAFMFHQTKTTYFKVAFLGNRSSPHFASNIK